MKLAVHYNLLQLPLAEYRLWTVWLQALFCKGCLFLWAWLSREPPSSCACTWDQLGEATKLSKQPLGTAPGESPPLAEYSNCNTNAANVCSVYLMTHISQVMASLRWWFLWTHHEMAHDACRRTIIMWSHWPNIPPSPDNPSSFQHILHSPWPPLLATFTRWTSWHLREKLSGWKIRFHSHSCSLYVAGVQALVLYGTATV